ncbi:MAG: hypothetical protein DMD48_07630 [Gemmatimonadetes bacterium]|nr:MAG: hypothetical protein DMD48_07630 [Gemmatimonadota bacterium]
MKNSVAMYLNPAAPRRDVVLAVRLQRLGVDERRIGALRVIHENVVAAQVIPRGRILLLTPRGQRLRQYALRVAQILGLLILKPRGARALQVQETAVDEIMAGLDVAPGRRPFR